MEPDLLAPVITAITNLQSDVRTIGGAMFVVTLVIVAFSMFRRTAR